MKTQYPSLNGLRALSILLVIFHHLDLQNNVFVSVYDNKWIEPFLFLITDGHFGVNVFFVISGFLITSIMLDEENSSGKIATGKFYIRRVLRIFPAYFFLLLFYFVLQLLGVIHINNESWLTALTYTKYINWPLEWYTAHAWSLSIEEQFYLFWPLVFMLGEKQRKWIAFALVLIVPFVRIFNNLNPQDWLNELTIFKRIDAIAIGCLFAIYKEKILTWMKPHWKKIFYLSFLIILSLPYLKEWTEKNDLGFIFIPLGGTHGIIGNLVIGFIMMFSVFGPQGIWFKFLNLRMINYIGILSYSLYLWQQFFINKTANWYDSFPVNLCCIIIMALFSYYFVEKPFLKLKSKFK